MKIFCPDCGKELLTIDTKFRKDGTKRRTRRCPACNKNWVSEVFEQRLGRSYIETETSSGREKNANNVRKTGRISRFFRLTKSYL